tara:strand:- start:190 stop:1029 length:840 start_codon:yes stop_codon:yes gene_type:complete
MSKISLIKSIINSPNYYIYTFIIKKILTRLFRHKIYPSKNKDLEFTYRFESPIMEVNNKEKDYREIKSPSLEVKEGNNKNIFPFAEFMSLDDRFCSFQESLNFENRKKEILIVKTKKKFLPGHKKRHKIFEKIKNDERFDYIDLENSKVNDLHNYYSYYQFIVVIENCDNESYTSEKYYDVIKSGAIPIYHIEKVGNFIHCFVNFNNIEDPEFIYKELIKFKQNYKYSEVAENNFKKLKEMRFNIVMNYLKYSALPIFALSNILLNQHYLFKLKRIFIK